MRHLLDTNVVLRFLLADDGQQSPQTRELFVWAETRGGVLQFPAAALAEAAWVLRSYYKIERVEIARRLRGVLLHPGVISEPVLLAALDLYEQHAVDFLDCMLAAETHAQSDTCLITFDRDYSKFPGLKWATPAQVMARGSR
jgi:predicted nucleic-acid-binding protein